MSTAPADYQELLREAINQARANAPRAVEDLRRCSSWAADAVAEVTGGAAALELVPVNQGDGGAAGSAYQLQLRKVGSDAPPSDLGIFYATAAGYPILRWYSRRAWDSRPDRADADFPGYHELEGHFRWLVSHPESRLVVLVTFFQGPSVSHPSTGSA